MDPHLNILFTSSRILLNNDNDKKIISGGILIRNSDGKIKQILYSQAEVNSVMYKDHAIEAYDYGNKIIMSGMIDTNVSIGTGDVEDYVSLTKSAAAGGFTTIIENSNKATSDKKLLEIVEAANDQLYVDLGIWGKVTENNLDEIIKMSHFGVVGFKTDLAEISKKKLQEVFEILEETKSPLSIHSEMPLKQLLSVKDDANLKKYETFLANRPASMELNLLVTVADLIKNFKSQVVISSLSSAECLPVIHNLVQSNKNLQVETNHHYLSCISEEINDGKTEFKCFPPIRNGINKNKLWAGIKSYDINLVSSNHQPSSIGTKCLIYGKNRGNFIEAEPGISSLQFCLPVFWTNAEKNGLSVFDVNRILSKNPAKLCGMDKHKGKIEVGYDADFCVWDPEANVTVSKEDILFKNKICPYIGKELKGRVCATIVRGYIVFDADDPGFDPPIGSVILKAQVIKSRQLQQFEEEIEEEGGDGLALMM